MDCPSKAKISFLWFWSLLLMKADSSAPADQNHRFLIHIWSGPQIVFKGLKLSPEAAQTMPLLSALISALSSEFPQQLFKLWTLWVFQLKVLMSFSSHPPNMVRPIIVMSYNLGTNFYLRGSFLLWKKKKQKTPWPKQIEEERVYFSLYLSGHTTPFKSEQEFAGKNWGRSHGGTLFILTGLILWLDQPAAQRWHCPQCVGFPISIINQENAPTGLPTGHLIETF